MHDVGACELTVAALHDEDREHESKDHYGFGDHKDHRALKTHGDAAVVEEYDDGGHQPTRIAQVQ